MNKNWGTDLSYFSHCCDEMLGECNVRKDGSALAHGLRVLITGKGWMHECEVAGLVVFTAMKQGVQC